MKKSIDNFCEVSVIYFLKAERRDRKMKGRSCRRSRGNENEQPFPSPAKPATETEKASSSRESSASNHNESSALLPENRPPPSGSPSSQQVPPAASTSTGHTDSSLPSSTEKTRK